MKTEVAVIMGSKNDLEILNDLFKTLNDFDVHFTARIMSAHRTPDDAAEFAKNCESNGIKVVICVAGMAAHLAGVIAAHTVIPVIGLPVASEPFKGFDALLSMVQMPPGIPVATVTAGKAGAKNAALLAVSILALGNPDLSSKLKDFRKQQAETVRNADLELQKQLAK